MGVAAPPAIGVRAPAMGVAAPGAGVIGDIGVIAPACGMNEVMPACGTMGDAWPG